MSKYAGKLITNQAPAGYSVYFDGTGDYLTLPVNAAFDLGTNACCVEAWVYPLNTSAIGIFCTTTGASGQTRPNFSVSTTAFQIDYFGSVFFSGSATIPLNTWSHVAFTRAATNGAWRFFLNGVLTGYNATGTQNLLQTTVSQTIGFYSGTSANAYISNVRIVNGSVPTPYQTSSTTTGTTIFAPPTQLLNVTNTSLLTCNSPAIVDQSSNAFAITANGNAAVSTFTPFTAYVPYNPALGASTPGVWTLDEAMQAAATRQWNMYDPYFNLTTLLLHGNGTNTAQNNTFLDSGTANGGVGFTITRNPSTGPNAPTQGSFSPFSQTGWSVNFGTSDTTWTTTDIRPTADFTIEGWIYPTNTSETKIIVFGNESSNRIGFFLQSSTLQLGYDVFGGPGVQALGTPAATVNTWNHCAIVRSGSTVTGYINGVAGNAPKTLSGTLGNANLTKTEGNSQYISNMRYITGQALYTGTFTPATSPLTTTSVGSTGTGAASSITGTVRLLVCQDNRFKDNSSNNFSISAGATASVQAFSPFYPTAAYTPATIGGSGYFDGTGDYLVTSTTSAAFAYGTGDFTYSAWIYPLNVSGTKVIIDGRRSADKVGPVLYLDNATLTGAKNETTNVLAGGTVTANAWNFVELTRTSSNWRLFVNGFLTAGPTADAINYSANQLATVGANGMDASQGFAGYIADARVLKGTGGTSSTIPTSPLTNITNTSLLCNFTNAGIVDSTAKNVLETVGNAQISTTQSKFGGSSMSFDGTGDYIIEPTNLNFGYGTGDFTIEFWLRLNSTATQTVVSNLTSASSVNPHLYILSGGSIRYYTANADRITGSTLSANQWYHVALCRSGTSTRLFIDGTQSGSTYTDSNNYGTTAPLGIGTYWASGTPVTADTLNGYIDDLRITKLARYTANFTPQTSQWQDQ